MTYNQQNNEISPASENKTQFNFFGFEFDNDGYSLLEHTPNNKLHLSEDTSSGEVTPYEDKKGLTKSQIRFIRTCVEVQEENANNAKALAYYPPYLSKTTLPVSKTKELIFERENGHLRLSMSAHPDWGLPYGKIARRLLVHLVTYAILNKTPVIPVVSLRQLSRDLGMTPSGDGHKLIHDMIMRLMGVTMYVMGKNELGEQIEVNRCGILDSACITNDKNKPKQIVLDAKFFGLCEDSAAPVDMRVIQAIQSPIEFDIYVFLLARLLTVRSITRIKWVDFMRQFGSENKNIASAKQRLKKAIDKVTIIQPQMNVEYTNDFVILKPSASAIKTRAGAFVLASTIVDTDDEVEDEKAL